MAARSVARLYDSALRDVGLTNTQFTLLVATGNGGFRSMSELGEILCIDRSTLSRNFKPLIAAGFVVRPDSAKGRSMPLELTEAGRAKVRESYAHWERAQKHMESRLDDRQLSTGRRVLRDLRMAAETDQA